MRIKFSFAQLFTSVSLVIILFTTVSLMTIFFYNLRKITTNLIETNTKTTVAHSRDIVTTALNNHEEALKLTATGISHFFSRGNVSTEAVEAYLSDVALNVPNSLDIYFVNNTMWNKAGGFAAFASKWVPDDDWDNTQRDWFIGAKKTKGKTSFSEPYVDSDTSEVVITVSMTVNGINGEDIGVVADDVEVNNLGWLLNELKSFQGQGIYIINKDGLFITNEDVSMVMKKDFFREKGLEQFRNEVLLSDDFFTINNNILIDSSVIHGTDWILVTTIPGKVIFAEANRLLFLSIILTSALLVLSAIFLILFIRRMVRPLGTVVKTLHEISTDWNLGKRLNTGKAGGIVEIEEISGVFNLTFESMEKLIGTIKKQTGTLAHTGTDLSSNSAKTAAAVEQMAANIQSIKLKNGDQDKEMSESSSFIADITNNINILNKYIGEQSENVNRSSTAIEGMISSIKTVTETLYKNTDNVNELSDSSNAGKTSLQEVSNAFGEIARESEGLLEINSVMNNIASQTNLLSMNAAIEAAHAGEVGKGFAVVADEIRKLAESSAKQSKTTGSMLKKIKASIDGITQSIRAVIERFEHIDEKVRTVTHQEKNILAAMREQEVESRDILKSISSLSVITGQVKGNSENIAKQSDEIGKKQNVLLEIASEVTNRIDEMAIGAEQINAAVSNVNDMSKNIKSSTVVLNEVMSQFTVSGA